jgi:hypothetical protein
MSGSQGSGILLHVSEETDIPVFHPREAVAPFAQQQSQICRTRFADAERSSVSLNACCRFGTRSWH